MLLSPGDRVDRYEVIELLGTGGMGEVYRARDPKLARLVALKILRVDRGPGSDGPTRLLREARAVAALTHPNVLAVYDVGEVQEPEALRGLSYIAMELVVGRSLRAYLGDAGVPMAKRVGWLRDVASALDAAHRAGIVHRDVKPENVMVREDGVVKVLDFGIARRAAPVVDAWSSTEGHSVRAGSAPPVMDLPTLTGQGAVVGTPFYMAPEQLRGETLDARADQFAWGVVAYTLVTGKPPWPGRDQIALLLEIVSYQPPAPNKVEPSVPPGVSRAIVRALAKQREERFGSMAELIDELGSTADAVPAAAPPKREERATLSPRLVVGALVAVLALGSGALAWRARGRSPSPATPAAAAPAATPECTTNAECVHAHGGEAWHCHSKRHVCVPIASEDCKAYVEPHESEANDVVWLGGLFPVNDPAGASELRAPDLARQDFAQALGPNAERSGKLHARPIALAICDEGVDESRAARHLVEDIEVPAVLGFRSSSGASRAISSELLPNGVLSMVSISQLPEITRIPEPEGEPRLVWRTTLNYNDSIRPLGRLVSEVLEPAARVAGLGARALRVAAVVPKTFSHDYVDAVFNALHFNGKSALDNGSSFRQFVYDADAPGVDDGVVGALATFAPQIVYFGGRGFAPKVLLPLEKLWHAGPRPTYITSSGVPAEVLPFAGKDASRRRRFLSVTNLSTTATNAELVLHYNLVYPREPIERTNAPQPSYDAFYVLAYATYAIGDGPVTGATLSMAIDRLLPPAKTIPVGPASIYDGFSALRSGAKIDLVGAIGSLDFDRTSGEAPIDYSVVCLGTDDEGRAAQGVDSGMIYDARTDRLVGSMRCP